MSSFIGASGPSQYVGTKTYVKNVKVKIYAYWPLKFQQIRNLDNISHDELIYSLQVDINRDRIFKAGEASGKSGSFFFFSHDNKFLIKTMKGSEKYTLINMLDEFIEHIKESGNRSFLARIYGVYTIKT